MSTPVSIYEAKTHLSRLVSRAEHGEEFVLTRSGRPVARLVALEQRTTRRVPGALRDRIVIAEDFDDFSDADWYGA